MLETVLTMCGETNVITTAGPPAVYPGTVERTVICIDVTDAWAALNFVQRSLPSSARAVPPNKLANTIAVAPAKRPITLPIAGASRHEHAFRFALSSYDASARLGLGRT